MVQSVNKSLYLAFWISSMIMFIFYVGIRMSNHDDHFNRKLVTFWCDDLPPMNDVLRIVFYSGLLLIAVFAPVVRPRLGDSPLQAPELYTYTLPEFFTLEGFMKVFGRTWITSRRLRVIRAVCLLAWIGCIIGFGGIWSPILAGICIVILHGIVVGCVGTNHRWYVPVYTMLALILSNGNGLYSVDYYFSLCYTNYPFKISNSPSLITSGIGRKVTLVSGVMTLFFGGLTKIFNSGPQWMDGNTLGYHISEQDKGQSPWLKDRISKCQPVLILLSVKSIIFEIGSPCALFITFVRPIILVLAGIFHLGIWLTLTPNYLPQTWCYLLGSNYNDSVKNQTPVNLATLTTAWSITAVVIFLMVCALLRIEYWPLTSVPMYSFYRDASYSHMHLKDVKQARHVSLECINNGGYPIGWSVKWIVLRLVDSVGNVVDIDNLITQKESDRGVLLKQWARTKSRVAAQDIIAKSDVQLINYHLSNSETYPAQTWLFEHVNIWRSQNWSLPAWTYHDDVKLQLAVRLKTNDSLILASILWMEKQSREKLE